MHPIRPALALLACALAGNAAALSCGDTVSGHLVLTADLHCTSGWTALYVAGPGVTIDLNGHTLSGDIGLAGITLNSAHGTVIKGPGELKGFWNGVNGVRSDDVLVSGVVFSAQDVGVSINNSDRITVVGNTFQNLRGHAVTLQHLGWATGGFAGAHHIADNLVEDARAGFQLCGAATGGSVIEGNTLRKIEDYAIHLQDGSAGNRVVDNRLADVGNAGIMVNASNGTRILGNYMKGGRIGITLNPDTGGLCDTGGAVAEVRDTLVDGNTVLAHETALVAGLGAAKSGQVFDNRINGNKFYYDTTGILLLDDAWHNDATGNAYTGTTDPVRDFGYGNAW